MDVARVLVGVPWLSILLALTACPSDPPVAIDPDGTSTGGPSSTSEGLETDATTGPTGSTSGSTGVETTAVDGTTADGTTTDGTTSDGTTSDGTTSDGTTSDGTTSDGTTSGDTGPEPSCGNGIVEGDETCDDAGSSAACDDDCTAALCGDGSANPVAGEDCDGPDLLGATCQSLGFDAGPLSCSAACAYDTSGCLDLPSVAFLGLVISPIKQFDFSWLPAPGADYYQLLESAASGEPFVQVGGDLPGPTTSITVPLHLRLGASYVLRTCSPGGCADSPPTSVVGSLAAAVGYVKASNTDADDRFGTSVALSADGSTLAVAALYEDSSATGSGGNQADDSISNAGAVYVFVRDGLGQWSQQAYLKASNPDVDDYFGWDLALSDDGSTLAVGAMQEDSGTAGIDGDQADDSTSNAGAVYVFARDGMDQWSQQAYVKASNPDVSDRFGYAVALSGDGSTLAVGAESEDGNATGIDGNQANDTAFDSGAVYVFVRDPMDQWSQQAYVKASNTDSGDAFGGSVALGGSGDTLAVGAQYEASSATGIDGNQLDDSASDAGAVYVFVRDAMDQWSQQVYLKASNPNASDLFGQELALSDDGNALVVSAPQEDGQAIGLGGDEASNAASNSGAVYVFVRDPMDQWSQRVYAKAPNTDLGDRFGSSVALSGDANTLAVGASLEDGNGTGIGGNQANDSAGWAGAAYLY